MKHFIIISLLLFSFSVADAQVHRTGYSHSANGTDSNAQAFINATGITDSTIKVVINTLVIAAKAHGWWDLCKAIYLFVGGSATTHKYNLKDPRDLNAAFRLTFNGGWTHSSTGALPNGADAFANTWLIPRDILMVNDCHVSVYSRTNSATGGIEIGSHYDSQEPNFDAALFLSLKAIDGATRSLMYSDNAGRAQVYMAADTRGLFLASRAAINDHVIYRNGSSIASNSSSQISLAALSPLSLYLATYNYNGDPNNYASGAMSNKELAFVSIGKGINSTIATLMYIDIQNFETALGRQV